MIFTVSRASDSFMTVELPDPGISPHPFSKWDKEQKDWVMEINNPEDLLKLCDKDERLIVDYCYGPHIEIDDVMRP